MSHVQQPKHKCEESRATPWHTWRDWCHSIFQQSNLLSHLCRSALTVKSSALLPRIKSCCIYDEAGVKHRLFQSEVCKELITHFNTAHHKTRLEGFYTIVCLNLISRMSSCRTTKACTVTLFHVYLWVGVKQGSREGNYRIWYPNNFVYKHLLSKPQYMFL